MKRRDLVWPRLACTWQLGPGAAGGGGTAPAEGTRASGASGSGSGMVPKSQPRHEELPAPRAVQGSPWR